MKKEKVSWKRVRTIAKNLRGIGDFYWKNPWRLASLLIVLIFLLFLPGTGYYETLQLEPQSPLVRASSFDNLPIAPYPQKTGGEVVPYLTAESVEIRDLDSAVPMFELNPNERLRPASITKLMTALVALDYYQLTDILLVKRLVPVKDESEMGLHVGDQLTVQNLIYGLLVPSGNDAAYTLADNYPGGIENFIYSMNKKAEKLHLENTHFDNPSGIDTPGQYTTAQDLSLLTSFALKNNLITRAVVTEGITLGDASGKKSYTMHNVNQLLGLVPGVDGVKTGFTDLAGQCLITSVSRDGHRVVIILLKSKDRFGESARLVEWVFRNFQWQLVKP